MSIGNPNAPPSKKRAPKARIDKEHRRTRASRGPQVPATRTLGSWRQLWWIIVPQLVSQLPQLISAIWKLWESSKPSIGSSSAEAEFHIRHPGRTHHFRVVGYVRFLVFESGLHA